MLLRNLTKPDEEICATLTVGPVDQVVQRKEFSALAELRSNTQRTTFDLRMPAHEPEVPHGLPVVGVVSGAGLLPVNVRVVEADGPWIYGYTKRLLWAFCLDDLPCLHALNTPGLP